MSLDTVSIRIQYLCSVEVHEKHLLLLGTLAAVRGDASKSKEWWREWRVGIGDRTTGRVSGCCVPPAYLSVKEWKPKFGMKSFRSS